jgi:competence protein ComEA
VVHESVAEERADERGDKPADLAERLDDLLLRAEGVLVRHRSATALVVLAAAAATTGWLLSRPPPDPGPVEQHIPYAQGVPTPAGTAPASAMVEQEPAGLDQSGAGEQAAQADQPEQAELVVHVVGAVARPGVLTLAPGARVGDALAAAGGATADGEADRLNLAQLVEDGMQIRVPTVDEAGADGADGAVPLIRRSVVADAESTGGPSSGPVNVNTAQPTELEQLPGIGPATAAAIVTWRDEHGPFAAVDDLLLVPGIGPAKLAAVRDLVAL